MRTLTLRIPKLREGTSFPYEILKPYLRVDRAMIATIAETYKLGLSQSKIEKAAAKLRFGELSLSTVSRICASLDAEAEDFSQEHLKVSIPIYDLMQLSQESRRQSCALTGCCYRYCTVSGWLT